MGRGWLQRKRCCWHLRVVDLTGHIVSSTLSTAELFSRQTWPPQKTCNSLRVVLWPLHTHTMALSHTHNKKLTHEKFKVVFWLTLYSDPSNSHKNKQRNKTLNPNLSLFLKLWYPELQQQQKTRQTSGRPFRQAKADISGPTPVV